MNIIAQARAIFEARIGRFGRATSRTAHAVAILALTVVVLAFARFISWVRFRDVVESIDVGAVGSKAGGRAVGRQQ
jgi:hypothetical protein